MSVWIVLQPVWKLVCFFFFFFCYLFHPLLNSTKTLLGLANPNSGTGDGFCQAGCLSDYGECKGISVTDSWRRALKDGKTDEEAGGQYYWDSTVNLFWTWDTPAIIDRKFKDIVNAEKLGGIMAWSLGEDTLNWEHLKAMQKGLGK